MVLVLRDYGRWQWRLEEVREKFINEWGQSRCEYRVVLYDEGYVGFYEDGQVVSYLVKGKGEIWKIEVKQICYNFFREGVDWKFIWFFYRIQGVGLGSRIRLYRCFFILYLKW